MGLAVRVNASTGGSNFVALIIKSFLPHLSTAELILLIDGIIVIVVGVVFKSFEICIYSLLTMYLSSKMTDLIVVFGESAKTLHIFSPQYNEIANRIMQEYERGVSGLHCTGMYSRQDGCLLFCVVSPKEVPKVVRTVKEMDPTAFIVIEDALQVYGEGFKE